jgi:hypothetical protein
MVAKRSASVNLEGGAPDRIAVAIDVKRAIGGADDDCDWSARAALRVPGIVVTRERTQHFGRHILWREQQARIRREMRYGRIAVTHYDGAPLRGRTEK